LNAIGRVPLAGCVLTKGINTGGRVEAAGIARSCAAKCTSTSGGVVAAGCVARERTSTGGCVVVAVAT